MQVEIFLFLFMGICAVFDGRRREIPLPVVWLGIVMALVLRVQGAIGEEGEWLWAAASVLPGVIFWGLSFITREKVGYGDGWMLIMVGLYVGLWRCCLILLAGLVAESAIALALLAAKRITKDREIPFAPFLLLGMGVVICL